MSSEIRKLRDLGNGSGGVTIPRDTLRSWGLIDDDDELVDAHLHIHEADDAIEVRPVGPIPGGSDDDSSKPKRSTGRSIPASKADL
ncbi:hypothetical protein ACFPM1_03610 [Halorubrum rubrum]|uniref:DUF8053 domain-containing protein n=1 Tax=Halorubrum rubrum TaxID=1126240 RepID=A0ABD5QZC4_9EURY|nr:hypothetical protein [Halorubrum rubrum]